LNRSLHIFLVTAACLGFLLPSLSFKIKGEDDLTFIKTIPTPVIQKISSDRYGFIYFADERGNIYKYDQEGNLLLTFSPKKNSEVTLLEAWRNVNILVFYRNYQEFIFLNRFLTETPNFSLNEESQDHDKSIGFARLATFTADNNLWIIDDDDFSLKKYDLTYNKLDINTPLDLILDRNTYDFNFIREYQNLLFINDKNSGILMFDNLANYKNKLPFKGLNYFSFLNNDIYFLERGYIKLFDIYTGKENKVLLPEGKQYNMVILGDKKAYLFTNKSIDIYNCPFCIIK
jgi:hypothetical protein